MWLWIKKKKKYWILDMIPNRPPDLKDLMERLRLIKWKEKKHKLEEIREIDKGKYLEHEFKKGMIRSYGGLCKSKTNKLNDWIEDVQLEQDNTAMKLKEENNLICYLCNNNLKYGENSVNCNTQSGKCMNRILINGRAIFLNELEIAIRKRNTRKRKVK
jgi:hypothetical protein